MRRWIGSLALTLGLAAFGLACNTGISTPTSVVVPTTTALASITVNGASVGVGGTTQFTATGALNDGTTRDLTAIVVWQSSNTSIATVSTTGVVTGLAPGNASVTATYQNIIASYQVVVTP
ncbi:MAG: Ig-like domain-containing protein [Bacteroidales bacterium]